MKVFRITPTEQYSGGAAYVAANDVEEAIKIFRENDHRDYEYEYGDCICEHVVNMSYNTDKPFVIFDDLWLD